MKGFLRKWLGINELASLSELAALRNEVWLLRDSIPQPKLHKQRTEEIEALPVSFEQMQAEALKELEQMNG